MANTEFQAIVLAAGGGSRYSELTGDRPKCLLPVGPFPMIFYPLNMLEKHGFQEIIIIVLETQRSEIQQALERTPIKAKLDFATIPMNIDYGTADAIKHIQDRWVQFNSIIFPTVCSIEIFLFWIESRAIWL